MAKVARLLGLLSVLAVGIWLGRLAAHGRTPPPEGRWRELTEDQLG